jgi:hypothetical protein
MTRTHPTHKVRLSDEELRRQLAEFEVRHGMKSQEFLRRYTAGELGDDLAFIRWSGLRIASKVGLFAPTRP